MCTLDLNNLSIRRKVLQTLVALCNNRATNWSRLDIYNLITALKEKGIDVNSTSSLEELRNFVNTTVLNTIKENKEKIIRLLDNILKDRAEQKGEGAVDPVPLEDEPNEETTTPENRPTTKAKNKVDDILGDFYVTAFSAKLYRQQMFVRDAFDVLVVDRKNRKIIKTENDLNYAIAKKKDSYYKILKAYTQAEGTPLDMFDFSSGYVNREYIKAVQAFESMLPGVNYINGRVDLQSAKPLQLRINNGWIDTLKGNLQSEDAQFFQALNAYINLKYFDSLLADAAGDKVLSIDKDVRNFEVGIKYGKYKFGDRINELRKGWSTGENVDALKEASNYSKMIISSIPFIDFATKQQRSYSLNPAMFTVAITNLQGALLKAQSKGLKSGNREALEYLCNFHDDPRTLLEAILDALFVKNEVINKEGKQISEAGMSGLRADLLRSGLTEFDLNILYSIHLYLFGDPDYSMKRIEYDNFYAPSANSSFTQKDFGVIECLSGFIDRVMQANYLETSQNSDGETIITVKKKFSSRNKEMNLRNLINLDLMHLSETKARLLAKKYTITSIPDGYSVTINGKDYTLTTRSSNNNIFNANDDVNGCVLKRSNGDTLSSLLTEANITKALQGEPGEINDILHFIQEILGVNLFSERGKNKVLIGLHLNPSLISLMMKSAIRAATVVKFTDDYYNSEYYTTDASLGTLYKYIIEEEDPSLSLTSNDRRSAKIWNTAIDPNNPSLIGVRIYDNWVEVFTQAETILEGGSTKSNTKDIFRNDIGNFSISFLGGNLAYYLNQAKYEKNLAKLKTETRHDSALAHLLFSRNIKLLQGIVINQDAESKDRIKKSVRNMNTGELIFQSMFNNFYGTFFSGKNLLGSYIIQPTTYSDKTKIINYIVNAQLALGEISGNLTAKLHELSNDLLVRVYIKTVGAYYNQAYSNTLLKYVKIFNITDFNNNEELLQQVVLKLKEISTGRSPKEAERQLTSMAQQAGVELFLDFDYRRTKNGVEFNELLDYYANYLYKSPENLKKRLNVEARKYVNEIINSNLIFYTKYLDNETNTIVKDTINNLFPFTAYKAEDHGSNDLFAGLNLKEGDNIRNSYEKKWVQDGRLILARSGDKVYIYGENIDINDENIEINPIIEKYVFTESLLANNLRLSLTGTELQHPAKNAPLVSLDNSRFENPENFYALNKDSYEKIESITLLAQLKRNVIIPGTLQYFQQGTLRGTPRKNHMAIIRDPQAKVFNYNGEEKDIDGNDGGGLCCSLVSILENYSLQDLKVGDVKKTIMHAPLYDTGGVLLGKWAIQGIENENMRSSRGNKIDYYRLNKAMLNLQWYLLNNGVAELNSEFIDLDRMKDYDLIDEKTKKKIIGGPRKIDLTYVRGKSGMRPIDFLKDIIKGRDLFYEVVDENTGQNIVKEIRNFGKTENGIYYTEESKVLKLSNTYIPYQKLELSKVYHLFDADSNKVELTEEEISLLRIKSDGFYEDVNGNVLHTINSNYELVEAMGGIYSVDYDGDGGFKPSNSSNYAAVEFMNVLAYINTNKTDSTVLNQDMYYQPLKDCMIHYAVNSSAIKNGAGNINQEDVWYNPEKRLQYITIGYDGIGVQQDSDHEVDEALLTEFSQVLSSLDALGNLHEHAKKVYENLRRIARSTSMTEIQVMQEFIKRHFIDGDPKDLVLSLLYDLVTRAIISNFKNHNEANLASEILERVKRVLNKNKDHLLDEFKVPFSDPGVYKALLPTFASQINRKSVKRKYPGSGMVQCMSFGFKLIYEFDGICYQFKDIVTKLQRDKLTAAGQIYQKNPGESRNQWEIRIVNQYLQAKQLELEQNATDTTRALFHPTDKVKVVATNRETGEISQFSIDLSSVSSFVAFTQDYWWKLIGLTKELASLLDFRFYHDITQPRDLAPARTTWEEQRADGTWVKNNIFREEVVLKGFTDTIEYETNGVKKKLIVAKDSVTDLEEFISEVTDDTNITNAVLVKNASKNSEILEFFRNLKHGFVDRNGVLMPIRNLEDRASEVIMASLFKSKYVDHTDLPKILAHPELLKIEPKLNIPKKNEYHITLGKRKGPAAFITFNTLVKGDKVSRIEWKHTKPKDVRTKQGIVTVIYSMDRDSLEQIPIAIELLQPDLRYNEAGQIVNSKNEVIKDNTNSYVKGVNNEVYKIVDLITLYEVTNKVETNNVGEAYVSNTVYQVNYELITQILGLKHLRESLKALYDLEKAEDIRFSTSSDFWNNSAISIENFKQAVKNINLNDFTPAEINALLNTIDDKLSKENESLIETIKKEIKNDKNWIYKLTTKKLINNSNLVSVLTALSKLYHTSKNEELLDTIDKVCRDFMRDSRLQAFVKTHFEKLSIEVQTSFRRALKVICSRIPAQSLQSFLQGEVVGFLQTSTGYAYVSPWLLYLQGSDYRLYFVDITSTLIKIVVI